MPWFTLYAQGTSAWLGIADVKAPDLPSDAIGVQEHVERPNLNLTVWSPQAIAYVPRVSPVRVVLSRREFEQRWTSAERRHLAALFLDTATAIGIRSAIYVAEKELDRSSAVELNLAATIEGSGEMLDLIIATGGPVTALTKAARLAAILAPIPVV